MKPVRRTLVLNGILLIAISASGYLFWYKPKFRLHPKNNMFTFKEHKYGSSHEAILRLKQKAAIAKDFVIEHGYNSQYCFLLDMKQPSGKKRFFVYSLATGSVEIAGLVTHGRGSVNGTGDLIFSNIKNSNCTSTGKYKTGKSYNGNFGLAYKLYGLDNTNTNAFDRFVVLHSNACVPNDEVSSLPIFVSLGCPTYLLHF